MVNQVDPRENGKMLQLAEHGVVTHGSHGKPLSALKQIATRRANSKQLAPLAMLIYFSHMPVSPFCHFAILTNFAILAP